MLAPSLAATAILIGAGSVAFAQGPLGESASTAWVPQHGIVRVEAPGRGSQSAVVVRSDGLAVTAASVVRGQDVVDVVFGDGTRCVARVVLLDHREGLALLEFDAPSRGVSAAALEFRAPRSDQPLFQIAGREQGELSRTPADFVGLQFPERRPMVEFDPRFASRPTEGALVDGESRLLGVVTEARSEAGRPMARPTWAVYRFLRRAGVSLDLVGRARELHGSAITARESLFPHPGATHIVQPYDFTDAETLEPTERVEQAMAAALRHHARTRSVEPKPEPRRGTEAEIARLEELQGAEIDAEYRAFLRAYRFLSLSSSREIHGLDMPYVTGDPPQTHRYSPAGRPWVSEKHVPGRRILVIGHHFEFADGDQLLMDVEDPSPTVWLYLHDPPTNPVGAPLVEPYAPSFSLALWRIVDEWIASDLVYDWFQD